MTSDSIPLPEAVRRDVVLTVVELGRKLVRWRDDEAKRAVVDPAKHKLGADVAADRFLRETLHRLTPSIPVVSEEDAAHDDERPELYWLLDPIDGTASWLGGFPGFVTQLALIAREAPIFGVICAPVLGKTYVGCAGEPARLNGEILPRRTPADRIVVVDNTPKPHALCVPLMMALGTSDYHMSGSLGLKTCLVADGTADLFVKDVVVRDWDIAPALLVLNAVGGVLTQADGARFRLSGPFDKPRGLLVARDPELWERARRDVARIKGWSFSP